MSHSPFLIAVDWGTTSFRLWLLSKDGTVLAAQRSQEGMSEIAARGFETVLETHLSALGVAQDLPVVICGMAGSRQGWVEAGYLETPADLTTLGRHATLVPGVTRQIIILPGLAVRSLSQPDVMRGEETQLLGAHLEHCDGERYCLPGTHSKWVHMDGAKVSGFETYMSGELFNVIGSKTILMHSIGGDSGVNANDPAFLTGVRDGWTRAEKITHHLFSIRAGQLLCDYGLDDNKARLSGLLIGVEFAGAGLTGNDQVALVASGSLQKLYHSALSECGVTLRTIDADVAVQRGLMEAWQHFSLASGDQ